MLWKLFLSLIIAFYSYSNTWSVEEQAQYILTLDQAIEIAVLNNRALIQGYNNLENAAISIEQSRAVFNWQFLPRGETAYTGGGDAGSGLTLGAGLDIFKRFETGTSMTLGPSLLKSGDRYHSNLRFKFSQPLLQGFGREFNLAGVKSAEFNERTAIRAFKKSVSQLVLKTIEVMYEIVKLNEILKNNTISLEQMKKFKKAIQVKEKLGFAESLDIFRIDIELKQAEEALHLGEQQMQELKETLCELLNLPYEQRLMVDVPITYEDLEMDVVTATQTALASRIDIEQAWDQLLEMERLRRYAKKKLLPNLNLVLDYTNFAWDETFTGSFGAKREAKWGIGFTTDGFFDKTIEKGNYQQANLSLDNAKASCLQLKASIGLEVKRQIQFIRNLDKKIRMHEEQYTTHTNQFKIAKIKYFRGFANNFDVIQAEKSLRALKTTIVSEVVDHIVAKYRLLFIMGLLDENIFAPC